MVQIGDRKGKTGAINDLGNIIKTGRLVSAKNHFVEHSIYTRNRIQRGEVTVLNNLGNLSLENGDLREAERVHSECLRIVREIGFVQGEAAYSTTMAI